MPQCALCPNQVSSSDEDAFQEVVSWVHGPKADGAVLRSHTGRVAHADCVRKKQEGQAPGQETLFDAV